MNNDAMPTLEEIRQMLEPYNLTTVSRETGIPRHTIYRLRNSAAKPSYATVVKLVEWMRNHNAKRP